MLTGSGSSSPGSPPSPDEATVDLTIAVPVYNEEGNVEALCEEILATLRTLGKTFEIIFVDDGSKDGTRPILRRLSETIPGVRAVFFRRNFGQTAAMAAGADLARGRTLIFMDGDRQNDPADIPRLLEKIAEGFDVVCGWRKDRKDKAVTRKLPSIIANGIIRRVGGVPIHDLGCSLKAFRREVIKEVKLYGEMHRFIPIYANAVGARITELEVNHRARVAGVTKYGLMRTFSVLLDLVTTKFLMTYSARPMHFFGGAAFALLAAAGLSGAGLLINKLVFDVSMIRSPLLLLSATLLMLSVNFVLMGLLAEVQARTYYESQGKTSYRILEVLDSASRASG